MRGAHPERHLEAEIEKTLAFRPAETVLVACSGGPDSAALSALAARASQHAGATVVLAHINHGVRESAWQDEGVVLALGTTLAVRVLCASVDAAKSEERLREARYRALAGLAARVGASRVCTAHHAEDQTETILLALFRGTGHRGLMGMEPQRPLNQTVTLSRPLLRIGREVLRRYCERERLPYVLDESNSDMAFRRNALRAALSSLRGPFPHLDEAVARCAEIVREEHEDRPRAHVRRELREALKGSVGLRDVTFERLEAAARLVESQQGGRVFVRDGVEVTVRRG